MRQQERTRLEKMRGQEDASDLRKLHACAAHALALADLDVTPEDVDRLAGQLLLAARILCTRPAHDKRPVGYELNACGLLSRDDARRTISTLAVLGRA